MDRHGRAGIVDEVAGPPVVRSGVLGLLVALLQPNNQYIVQPGGNDDRSNVLVLGLYMLVQLWRHNGLGKIRRTSMLDWNKYRTDLKKRISEIGKLSPDTVRGYATLGNAGAQTNHLDAKTRELIALAVAVTTRCDGCITVHVDAALKHGATREEIAEALGVAVALNAGAALVFSARVMDAVDAHQ